jgi:hypothetical protein
MGTLVVFPEVGRAPQQDPPPARAGSAIVVILPVIRIERGGIHSPASATKKSKSPSVRKRRKRATQT